MVNPLASLEVKYSIHGSAQGFAMFPFLLYRNISGSAL